MTPPLPDPPMDAPRGFVYVAVPDVRWKILTDTRHCRMLVAGKGCGEVAVAALDRGRADNPKSPNWWAYCPDHLYGRWIEGGVVMHWVLRAEGEVAGD